MDWQTRCDEIMAAFNGSIEQALRYLSDGYEHIYVAHERVNCHIFVKTDGMGTYERIDVTPFYISLGVAEAGCGGTVGTICDDDDFCCDLLYLIGQRLA